MEKILITGGAGFIGTNLALKLQNDGYEVTVLDNLSQQVHGENPNDSYLFNLVKKSVHFIQGDVTDPVLLARILPGKDIIVHLAAETGTGQSMYEVKRYNNVNSTGTALILDFLINTNKSVKKFILASSRAIYGEGKYRCSQHGYVFPEGRKVENLEKGEYEPLCPGCLKPLSAVPTTEDSKYSPSSVYGITKLNQELLTRIVCESIGLQYFAFRFQNVYGPGQSLKNPYTGILSVFSTRILNDKPLFVFEDGKESRDFVYIDDVVDSVLLAIKNERISGIFNVGSGQPVDINSIAEKLSNLFNRKTVIQINKKFRIGDIRHNIADLTRIHHDLGFIPQVSIDKGLALFVKWVKSQAVEEDLFEKSIDEMKGRNLYK